MIELYIIEGNQFNNNKVDENLMNNNFNYNEKYFNNKNSKGKFLKLFIIIILIIGISG